MNQPSPPTKLQWSQYPAETLSPTDVSSIEALRDEWKTYIKGSVPAATQMSTPDRYRLELAGMMHEHECNGRTLFHLTLTYKPYRDRAYQESDVNNFFKHFYTRHFLQYLLSTKNIHTNAKKRVQPLCIAFVDSSISRTDGFNVRFAARLHHHAILAVHPDNVNKVHSLVGENTLANSQFSHKIMTSDLKQCDARRLLYASKQLKEYPDFLSFPDRMFRQRVQYSS